MYSHFTMSPHLPDIQHASAYQRCLLVGNWLMLLSLFLIIASTVVAYGFEQKLGLASIIAAHIITIVMAAFLKLGYVMRCIALRAFGSEAF